ncbi:MAG TPA: hypothetical protein VIA06_04630 [Candidatus Dormibacteraeota bacterium]|nr:hypothetical protein [Candidatus Dormibacteraeota bacterium]
MGVRWSGSERDGSRYAAPLRSWVPTPTVLADDLADLVRSLPAGWRRSDLVVGSYTTACRHLGLDHPAPVRTTALSAVEAMLYQAKLDLPDRTVALADDLMDDPRNLVEIGLRLAGMDARNASIVTGARPSDPGARDLAGTLREAADDVAVPVLSALDVRLERNPRATPEPGRELAP